MPPTTEIPSLSDLDTWPYLNDLGQISDQWQGKVGLYAIFDRDQTLQFVGFSRDISLSLQQHLVRCPQQCYWLKVHTIDRPNRTLLEGGRDQWVAENGITPPGNGPEAEVWIRPIDVKGQMTPEEEATYQASDELGKMKTLKRVARRIEAEVLATLVERGVQMQLRFDPKLKEAGLLNLK